MLKVVIAFAVGELIGFMVVAFFKGAKELETTPREPEPRCKTNASKECGDQCCSFCLGATDCKYACQLKPGRCGQVVKVN